MTAQLKIDQVGLSPGVAGRARTDGKADGSLVTLTNTGAGATTRFQLLWTPPGDVDAVDSLGATEEDPKVWTFSPTAGERGTYEVELIENEGLTSEKRERRAFVVRTPWLGLVIPALNERGDKSASLAAPGTAEAVDNNSVDDPNADLAALPFAGWWRAHHSMITALDNMFAPVRVTFAHGNGAGAIEHRAYATLGEALEVDYPSSFGSIAIYDIEPTVLDPVEAGPVELDDVVRYILRAARGRDSWVLLPAMVVPGTDLDCHGCSVREVTGGGALKLFDCSVLENVEASLLEMHRCSVSAPTLVSTGGFRARDCTFASAIAVTVTGGGIFERCRFDDALTYATENTVVTLDDCSFGATPSITFTGDPGVVHMDARTKFLWDAATGGVTNGTITVEAAP
jgi:hypothetical protein